MEIAIIILPDTGFYGATLESNIRSYWSKTSRSLGFIRFVIIHVLLWIVYDILGPCYKVQTSSAFQVNVLAH